MYEKHIAQRQIYQALVENARAMQDMKYALLLAKEHPKHGRGGKVIGMIEFGISMIHDNNTSNGLQYQRRFLMIGTVCTDRQYRKMGIASALIRQCETIVQRQWEETEIYAHIEKSNHMAIQCFTKLGYTAVHVNSDGITAPRVDSINVRRRHTVECVPHLLFMKKLLNGVKN
jgi:ribosomal protein S18 acetylase RimI-like enzyme